jgi:putative two-component system response regulator
MQILAVDDDLFHLKVLEKALAKLGHSIVRVHSSPEALDQLRHGEIHLVITDWEMPNMDGLALCRAIREDDFNGYVYIIMLTGREGAESRREGFAAGADAFLNKPLNLVELEIALQMADRILGLETRNVALFALAKLAESRDPEVGGHIERVQSYTRLLAQSLTPQVKELHRVDAEFIRLLYQTSALHDLGKVGVPDGVLLKPGKLTPHEFEIMKSHTTLGAQTLDAALQRFPNVRFLQIARDIAASHHERFDGSGYPCCLAGEQIPFCGRIVAVADVYDALTSRRVYKEAMAHEDARELILLEREHHFDPDVVDAFLEAETQIVAVQARLRDDPPRSTSAEISLDRADPIAPPQAPAPILVVQDNPTALKLLVDQLKETGVPVLPATTVADAMKIFRTRLPALVVSDLEMAGATSIDLCRQIRASPGSQAVHFIMLTVHTDQNSMLEAYKVGVDDFVAKPYNPDELLARVRAGLRTCRLHQELMQKTSHLQAANLQLSQLNGRLDRLSITDDLTGLFNRRHAMQRLQEQWALAERYSRPLTIGIVDVDRFKHVNDTLGHDAGDIVLRRIAAVLRDQTRGTDTVCRIGGEEFLIIFPSETADEAVACCTRCQAAVEASQFRVGDAALSVTVSIGIAARTPEMSQFTELLRTADKALHAAKHAGRNRVCRADVSNSEEVSTVSTSTRPKTVGVTPTSTASTAPIKWDQLLTRCGGEASLASAIAKRFVAHAPVDLARLVESLAKNDADAVRRDAHSLKSTTAYMSLDVASATCKQIEELAREGRLAEVPPLLPSLRAEIESATSWLTNHPQPDMAMSA